MKNIEQLLFHPFSPTQFYVAHILKTQRNSSHDYRQISAPILAKTEVSHIRKPSRNRLFPLPFIRKKVRPFHSAFSD